MAPSDLSAHNVSDVNLMPPIETLQPSWSRVRGYPGNHVDKMAELEHKIVSLELDRQSMLDTISKLERRLRECQEIKEEWDWFFTNALDMLLVHDLDGRLIRVNPAVERLLGYTAEEFAHIPLEDISHPDDLERIIDHLKTLADGADSVNFEARMRHKAGGYRWLAWTTPAPIRQGRAMRHAYAIARDITDSKLSQQELLYCAQHDALTGLVNRAVFDQSLQLMLARAERLEGCQVSLMLLDLDDFKHINDTFGHHAGDDVLRIAAARLLEACRKGDVVARLGGDEFACLAVGTSAETLDAMAERVLDLVRQPMAVGGKFVQVGCSIGIATSSGVTAPLHLFEQADRAMYRVKAQGKGGVLHFQPLGAEQVTTSDSR